MFRMLLPVCVLTTLAFACLQVAKLDAMNPRDPERREMLVTFLYVLQDAPEALLRDMWKDVSGGGVSIEGGEREEGRVGGGCLMFVGPLYKKLRCRLQAFTFVFVCKRQFYGARVVKCVVDCCSCLLTWYYTARS